MGDKKVISRSTSYPSIALDEALKKLQTLKDSHGINGEYGREATAKGMGYASLSGSSARAVAALTQYGLLNRNKDLYSISDLAKQYLMPIEEGQAQGAVTQAALQPSLLRKVYNEYKGQALPGQLKNILTITYGVQGPAAETALRIIKQSFRVGGLLTEEGSVIDIEAKDEGAVDEPVISQEIEPALLVSGGSGARGDVIDSTVIGAKGLSNTANLTEQGINLTGNGWQLTVLLKTTKRHEAETRKLVRDLLEAADGVADALYAEDSEG